MIVTFYLTITARNCKQNVRLVEFISCSSEFISLKFVLISHNSEVIPCNFVNLLQFRVAIQFISHDSELTSHDSEFISRNSE